MKKYTFDKKTNMYKSEIAKNKRRYRSPAFATSDEAIEWYNKKSLELLGYIKNEPPQKGKDNE